MFVQEPKRKILFRLTNITAKRDPLILGLPLIKICKNLAYFPFRKLCVTQKDPSKGGFVNIFGGQIVPCLLWSQLIKSMQ